MELYYILGNMFLQVLFTDDFIERLIGDLNELMDADEVSIIVFILYIYI